MADTLNDTARGGTTDVPPISSHLTGGHHEVSESVTPPEWNDYISRHPSATADHQWGWRQVIEQAFGHSSMYLVSRRGGRITGVLPTVLFKSRLFGRAVVSLPFLNYGGLLVSEPEAADSLLAHATERARTFGATHIELRHRARQRPELSSRSHKLCLQRRLPPTVDDLWKDVDRKVRNQVRKAQKEGLTATDGGSELIGEFYDVFARNMRDLGTPVYSKRLFTETLRAFPDSSRIFVVRLGAAPIAASLTVRFRDTLLVPWASALKEYRAQCPNMLLYWAMLEHSVKSGLGTFDFGRSSPGSGPHHFKLQWGAEATEMSWEYVLLTRDHPPDVAPTNPKFSAVVNGWKAMPLWVANLLGPSIVRNIP